jgi:signal transduction histidine kinase
MNTKLDGIEQEKGSGMSFRLGLMAALGTALIAMACVGILSYRKVVHEDEDQGWVTHTHQVLERLAAMRAGLTEQETGARGFITTGEEAELQSYESGHRQLQTEMAQVRELTQDNPRQQQALDRLEFLVTARYAELGKAIAARSSAGSLHEIAMTHGEDGKPTADALQSATTEMEAEEKRLLSQRLDRARRSSQTMKILIIAGNAVAFAFLFVAGLVISQEMGRRHQAEENVLQSNAELEAANKELQAFSYSVSHDLRAPLRSIDGFSLALLEDYENKLDDDGKDQLQRIRAATVRMGQLIDGMLNLARISRAEMIRESVNLSSLAQEIASELQSSQPERQAAFIIPANVRVKGDRILLRVVLENLLGNAWKFTLERPNARIELGTKPDGRETIHFVRDNGAGFDMRHADKLFGVFQRLHRQSEFPGTGVGLATVQRIIHRHGGRIWAEAKPGEGATFYFVLSDEKL